MDSGKAQSSTSNSGLLLQTIDAPQSENKDADTEKVEFDHLYQKRDLPQPVFLPIPEPKQVVESLSLEERQSFADEKGWLPPVPGAKPPALTAADDSDIINLKFDIRNRELELGPHHQSLAPLFRECAWRYSRQFHTFALSESMAKRYITVEEGKILEGFPETEIDSLLARFQEVRLQRRFGEYHKALFLLDGMRYRWEQLLGKDETRNVEVLRERGKLYFLLGDFVNARVVLGDEYAIRRRINGSREYQVAKNACLLADVDIAIEKFKPIVRSMAEWLQFRAKEKVFDKVTPQCLFRKGKAEFGLGLYRAARETFQQALSSMKQFQFRAYHTVLVEEYLARITYFLGDNEGAMKQYKSVMAIADAMFGRQHPVWIEFACNLAELLLDESQYGEALQVIDYAKVGMKDTLNDDHPLLSRVLACEATLKYHLGFYDEAVGQIQTAMALVERDYGPEHGNTAHIAIHAAQAAIRNGALVDGLRYAEFAVDVLRNRCTADAAVAWLTLAQAEVETRNYAAAEEAMSVCRDIVEEFVGKDGAAMHPTYLHTYLVESDLLNRRKMLYYDSMNVAAKAVKLRMSTAHGRARLYDAEAIHKWAMTRLIAGRYKGIQQILADADKALTQCLSTVGVTFHPLFGFFYRDRAGVERLLSHLDESYRLIEAAMEIMTQTVGREADSFMSVLIEKVRILFALQNHSGLIEMLDKAYNRRIIGRTKNHPVIIELLTLLGNVRMEIGDIEEALAVLHEVQELCMEAWGRENVLYAEILEVFGRLYINQRDGKKALTYIDECIEMRKIVLTRDHPATGTAYLLRGKAFMLINEIENAEKSFEECLSIRKVFLGTTHLDVAEAFMALADLYDLTKQEDKAQEYSIEALKIKKLYSTTENTF